jgi:hypothetical protein
MGPEVGMYYKQWNITGMVSVNTKLTRFGTRFSYGN